MQTFMEPLSGEEEEYYLRCLKDGDQKAKDILVERNLRLVAYVVKKYVNQEKNRNLDELISIGTIGLMKAVMSFDEKKGKKLSTYAAKCIDNELLMLLRSDKKTAKEISLYEPIGADGDGNEISLYDVIESDERLIEEQCETGEEIEKLKQLLEQVLTEREKKILMFRYGLYGHPELTQREVARRMGISRSYVSRIEKKALNKLRGELE